MTSKSKKLIAAGVGFLAVGTLLTAFAKSKAKDDPPLWREYPVKFGSITASLDSGGTLEMDTNPYSMDAELKIKKLFVQTGDSVNTGDILVEFNQDNIDQKLQEISSELSNAERQLADAQGNLEKAKLQGGLSTEAETQSQILHKKIEELRTQISQTENTRSDLQVQIQQTPPPLSDEVLEQYQEELKALNAELENPDLEPTLREQKETRIAEISQELQLSEEHRTTLEALQQDLQQIEQSLDTLKEQVTEAESSLDVLQAAQEKQNKIDSLDLSALERSIQGAVEQVSTLKKEKSEWEARKKELFLKAEKEGVVTELPFTEGQTVPAGNAVVVVSDNSVRRVKVMLSQEDIGTIEPGQLTEMQFLAAPDQTLTGKVVKKSLVPGQGGDEVVYAVWIEFDEEQPQLLQGMTCSVRFVLKRVENVLTLANKAIFLQDGKETVKLRLPDGTIEEKTVKTGFSDGRVSEIKSGLLDGDVVVIEG